MAAPMAARGPSHTAGWPYGCTWSYGCSYGCTWSQAGWLASRMAGLAAGLAGATQPASPAALPSSSLGALWGRPSAPRTQGKPLDPHGLHGHPWDRNGTLFWDAMIIHVGSRVHAPHGGSQGSPLGSQGPPWHRMASNGILGYLRPYVPSARDSMVILRGSHGQFRVGSSGWPPGIPSPALASYGSPVVLCPPWCSYWPPCGPMDSMKSIRINIT